VQIAALFGFNVATVCSAPHASRLRSLGANHVFDYRDPDVISKIRHIMPNLKYVFDTIGNETSSSTASQAIDPAGGTLCTVRPFKEFTENVSPQTKVTSLLVFTSFLKDHQMGSNFLPVSIEKKLAWLARR
jgi:NADPH:quinone reductase-like Zn-dependent oxidoreductase